MKFGDRLKELRESRGLYKKDIGELLGVSITSVSGYENSTKKPQMDKLKILANFFGVTIDDLLGDEGVDSDELEESFPEGFRMIRRASKELSEEDKKKLVQIMKAYLHE